MNKQRNWNISFEWELNTKHFYSREGNCVEIRIYPVTFSCWGARWGMPSLDPDDSPQVAPWWNTRKDKQ